MLLINPSSAAPTSGTGRVSLSAPFPGSAVATTDRLNTTCSAAVAPRAIFLNLTSGRGGGTLRTVAMSCRSAPTPTTASPLVEAVATAEGWANVTVPLHVSAASRIAFLNFTIRANVTATERVGSCSPRGYVGNSTPWGCASYNFFMLASAGSLVDLSSGTVLGSANSYIDYSGWMTNETWCTNLTACWSGDDAATCYNCVGTLSSTWSDPWYTSPSLRVSFEIPISGAIETGHRDAVEWNTTILAESEWWEYNALLRNAAGHLELRAAGGTYGVDLRRVVVT